MGRKAVVALMLLCAVLLSLGITPAQGAQTENEIIVTSPEDSGSGTFREALQLSRPGTEIRFSSAVFPPHTPVAIQILSPLPVLSVGLVTIDASDAGVIVDGSQLSPDSFAAGLAIYSDGNVVMGLQIVDFPGQGIQISDGAQGNRIGGSAKGEGNVIGGNWDGIGISGAGTSNNVVIGNKIGTDASGSVAHGNVIDGIWIGNNAQDNIIGGRFGLEGNLISGNHNNGIVIENSGGNVVTGNLVGLDVAGGQALGNGGAGLAINFASGNTIGGLEDSARNVFSGNLGVGIGLNGDGTSGNMVAGNYVGLSADGRTSAGNAESGIVIGDGARQNEIGPGNRIAYNGAVGILVDGQATTGNVVTRNSIFSNNGSAIINLFGSSLDIPAPLISNVGSRSVRGTAQPGQLIEVFSDADGQSRYFEGETTADDSGAFYFMLPAGAFHEGFVTATARNEDGSTSQLSASLKVAALSVGRELPHIVAPQQVSTEPAVLGTNLLLAGIAVLFFGFTSSALNDILKGYSNEIDAALAKWIPARARNVFSRYKEMSLSAASRWQFLGMWFGIVLVYAIIESFLDPDVPLLGIERLMVVLTLFSAGLVVSGLEWISDHYLHRRLVKRAVPHVQWVWVGLLLGIGSVVFSRLLHFTPGYVYGVVGVIFLLPKFEDGEASGWRALFVQSCVFAGGLLLWVLSAFLPARLIWMEPFLLTAFLLSLQGVAFELLPLSIFDGSDLWNWRKPVWFVLFALVFFCFFHFMLNPSGAELQALQGNSVQTLLVVMAIFGLITLSVWLTCFRLRTKK